MTFAGKQAGYADPTVQHSNETVKAYSGPSTFTGKQPVDGTDPTVSAGLFRRDDEQDPS